MRAPTPANEEARLQVLREYQILDTPAEQAFDDLVRLASHICGTPTALVSFVDQDRQWFKAKLGLAVSETSRDVAFCAHAILRPEDILIVPDATKDERFSANPLVTHEPSIRFYAGAPLTTEGGFAVGTLCVIDYAPKELTPEQAKALQVLRDQVVRLLELHRKNVELSQAIKSLSQAEKALSENERRYRELFMNSLGLICSHDLHGRLLLVNPAAAESLGYNAAELVGRNMIELLSPSVRHLWPSYLQRIRESELDTGLLRVVTKTGEERIWVYRNLLRDERGQEPYVIGHALDITERKRLEEQLRQEAIRDPLTHLFNRRYMEESMRRELRRATRHQRPLAVIMIDIDHFKRFNDVLGHDAGDAVLRTVGVFLKSHVRAEDIACRYGGEEFILILADAPLQAALQRAERLRDEIKQASLPHGDQSPGRITLSLGVAVFPDHGSTSEAILRVADKALYNAKTTGRDRVVVGEALE